MFTPFSGRRIPMSADGKGYVWELSSDSSSDDDVVEVDAKDVPAGMYNQRNAGGGYAGGQAGRKVKQEYLSDDEEITVAQPASKVRPDLRGPIDRRLQASSSRAPPPAVQRNGSSRLDTSKSYDMTTSSKVGQSKVRQQLSRFEQAHQRPNISTVLQSPTLRDFAASKEPQPASTKPTPPDSGLNAARSEPARTHDATSRHKHSDSQDPKPCQNGHSSGLRPLERQLLESCQKAGSLKRKTDTCGDNVDHTKKPRLGGQLGPIKIDDADMGENIGVALHKKNVLAMGSKAQPFMADSDDEENDVEMETSKVSEAPEDVTVTPNDMFARLREAQRAQSEKMRYAALGKKAGNSPGESLDANTKRCEKQSGVEAKHTQSGVSSSVPHPMSKVPAAPRGPQYGSHNENAAPVPRLRPSAKMIHSSRSGLGPALHNSGIAEPSTTNTIPHAAATPCAARSTGVSRSTSPQFAGHSALKSAVANRTPDNRPTTSALLPQVNVMKPTRDLDRAMRMELDARPLMPASRHSAAPRRSNTAALVKTAPAAAVSETESSLFIRDATAPPSWSFDNLTTPAFEAMSAPQPCELAPKARAQLDADLKPLSAMPIEEQNHAGSEQPPPPNSSVAPTTIPSAGQTPEELAKEMARQRRAALQKEHKERKERKLVGSRARSQRFRDKWAKTRNEETNKVQDMLKNRLLGKSLANESGEEDQDEDPDEEMMDGEDHEEDDDEVSEDGLDAEQLQQIENSTSAEGRPADRVASWVESQEAPGSERAAQQGRRTTHGFAPDAKIGGLSATGKHTSNMPVTATVLTEEPNTMNTPPKPRSEQVPKVEVSSPAPMQQAAKQPEGQAPKPTVTSVPITKAPLPPPTERTEAPLAHRGTPPPSSEVPAASVSTEANSQKHERVRMMRERNARNQQEDRFKDDVNIARPLPPPAKPASSTRPLTTAVYQAPVASMLPPNHDKVAENSLVARLSHEQRSRPSTVFEPLPNLLTSRQAERSAAKMKPRDRNRDADPFQPLPAKVGRNKRAPKTAGGPQTLAPLYAKARVYGLQKERHEAAVSDQQGVRTNEEDEGWFDIAENYEREQKARREAEELKQRGSSIIPAVKKAQSTQKPVRQDIRESMQPRRLSLKNSARLTLDTPPTVPENPSPAARSLDNAAGEVSPKLTGSTRPTTGGKTLSWETMKFYMDQQADTWNTLNREPQEESETELEVLTDEDKCFFAYQVQRREISQAELDDDQRLEDLPWLECGPPCSSSRRANNRLAKQVFQSSDPSMMAAIAQGSTLDRKMDDDGLAWATMKSEAGMIEVRVERRSQTRCPKATAELNLLSRYLYWVKEKVSVFKSSTPAPDSDVELFGETPPEPSVRVHDHEGVIEKLGVFSAPKQASQKAIAYLVGRTFTSQTTHIDRREEEVQALRGEVAKWFEEEVGDLEYELFRGSGEKGHTEWEVWVEKAPMTGPRNL